MLFAIIKKTNKPIKLIVWLYLEPGKLQRVTDSTGKEWYPGQLIPIGYKRYRKMLDDIRKREEVRAIKLALIAHVQGN